MVELPVAEAFLRETGPDRVRMQDRAGVTEGAPAGVRTEVFQHGGPGEVPRQQHGPALFQICDQILCQGIGAADSFRDRFRRFREQPVFPLIPDGLTVQDRFRFQECPFRFGPGGDGKADRAKIVHRTRLQIAEVGTAFCGTFPFDLKPPADDAGGGRFAVIGQA